MQDRPRLYGEFPQLTTRVNFLIEQNPKRPGTKSWYRFEKYFALKPKTVGEMLSAGAIPEDVRWDYGHKFISLDPDPKKRE